MPANGDLHGASGRRDSGRVRQRTHAAMPRRARAGSGTCRGARRGSCPPRACARSTPRGRLPRRRACAAPARPPRSCPSGQPSSDTLGARCGTSAPYWQLRTAPPELTRTREGRARRGVPLSSAAGPHSREQRRAESSHDAVAPPRHAPPPARTRPRVLAATSARGARAAARHRAPRHTGRRRGEWAARSDRTRRARVGPLAPPRPATARVGPARQPRRPPAGARRGRLRNASLQGTFAQAVDILGTVWYAARLGVMFSARPSGRRRTQPRANTRPARRAESTRDVRPLLGPVHAGADQRPATRERVHVDPELRREERASRDGRTRRPARAGRRGRPASRPARRPPGPRGGRNTIGPRAGRVGR